MVVGLWQWILVCFMVDCGLMVVWLDFVRIPPLAADHHSLFSSSLSSTQAVGFVVFNVGSGFNDLWV